MERFIGPLSNKMAKQCHLKAIRNTFITLLPVLFFGGLIAILGAAPVSETTTNGFMLAWAEFVKDNSMILGWMNTISLGFLSLYVCIGITYFLAKHYAMEVFIPIIISISAFSMVAISPQELAYGNVLAQMTYFDGKGLLLAFLVSIASLEAYRIMGAKNIGRIKMPDNVPPALADSFSALVPALIILAVWGTVFVACWKNGTTFAEWLSMIIAPAIKATDTLGFVIFVSILLNFAWFFGIHNGVFEGFLGPIEYGNLSLNAAAVASGIALPQVFTVAFWCYFGIIGGLGNVLSLSILCALSKSKQIKIVGRLGFIPALFGISEPLTFGLPIMLNPIFFIPCILTGVMNVTITYLLMSANIIGRTYAQLSYNMPSF
ncbi:Phosphotransferase system, EIIC, partial [Popillia japonica]